MRFTMTTDVKPKYPIYVVRRRINDDFAPGILLTSNDGMQWSNPALSGSPRALDPGTIKQFAELGHITELSDFLTESPWVKWEVTE